MQLEPRHPIYEFEEFRLDTKRRELTVAADGRRVPLKPKEYETLLFFVGRPGELLDKNTLLRGIWPDAVVEENNLNQQVTALRHLLGEQRGGCRFIMNVRGRGYQFVPDVVSKGQASSEAGGSRDRAPTRNGAAWQCYQHAQFLASTDDPGQWAAGVRALSEATRLDPDFASALASLAMAHTRLLSVDWPRGFEDLDRAEEAAQRAVALRPDLASSHVAAGSVISARGDWVAAEEHFRTAASLDEEWTIVGDLHCAHILIATGHLGRALALARASEAEARGAGSLGIALIRALVYLLTDRDDDARRVIDLLLAMGGKPDRPHVADVVARLALRAGAPDEATRVLQASLPPRIRGRGAERVVARVVEGIVEPAAAPAAIASLNGLLADVSLEDLGQPLRHQIICWYAELGDVATAFSFAARVLGLLARYRTVGTTWGGLWLRELRHFRSDPHFSPFAERLGLSAYWKKYGPPDSS